MAASRSSYSIRVDDLVGIPFVSRGRDPAVGLDCFGLFKLVMGRFGVEVPEVDVDALDAPAVAGVISEERRRWKRVEKPFPGCAVAIRLNPRVTDVHHVGVFIDPWRFIHTLRKTGSLISRRSDPYWKKAVKEFYAWAP